MHKVADTGYLRVIINADVCGLIHAETITVFLVAVLAVLMEHGAVVQQILLLLEEAQQLHQQLVAAALVLGQVQHGVPELHLVVKMCFRLVDACVGGI
jgi:hypothetical protein